MGLTVKKNDPTGAVFPAVLVPHTPDGTYKTNPTLAVGDVKISGDFGAFANIATLPTVTPAGGKTVKVTLSQAETNYDNIVIMFSDVAGAEWDELFIPIQTVAQRLDDVPTALENADALLDRADAIEAGLTLRGAQRLQSAILAGKISGAGSGTESFRNAVADSKDRVVVNADGNGNRSAITTDTG